MLEAVGRSLDADGATADAVLEALRWAYPYRLTALGGRAGDTVRIDIAGQLGHHWVLACDDTGAWQFVDRPGPKVVATASFSAEEAWRLLSNNLPPEQQASLDLAGDPAVVAVIQSTRAIIGRPNMP